MKPVWSWLINLGSNACSLFAIALVVILHPTLTSIMGHQLDKSNKEPSSFGIRVITPLLLRLMTWRTGKTFHKPEGPKGEFQVDDSYLDIENISSKLKDCKIETN